jgi:UDP-N-acetyl-D-mannosaminuronate dehydrogenase
LSLIEKFEQRNAKVAVIGMGYVGLPLAIELGNVGFEVWAVDVDERRVELLRDGKSYITDVPDEHIQRLREARRLRPTSDPRVLERVDAVIICVPTPLSKTREPDLSYVITATENVACHLQPEQLIVLESTTYPGTTEEIVLPRLQKLGWEPGRDFHLAFSPERIDPGNKKWTLRTVPKVVGGLTPECTKVACALYGQIVDRVIPVSSPKVAELTKLLENIFRSVNIALVNELMLLCDRMGIDVWEVIEAASTKPYGFMKFTPGPGLGGHCLEGGETVCVKSDNGVHVLPVKSLFERCKAENNGRLLRFQDAEVIVKPKVEVLSFDSERKQAAFQPAEYLFRRDYQGNMVTINTAAGTKLRVTDLHPMLVERDSGIVSSPAKELTTGDRLPLFFGINSADDVPLQQVDLLDYASLLPVSKIYVRPRNGYWKQFRLLLQPLVKEYGEKRYDFFRNNAIPLSVYLRLKASGQPSFISDEIYLVTGKGASHVQFPGTVTLDENFARLIGYYLSEGCITADRKSQRVRFTFHRQEQELIADLTDIITRLGLRFSIDHSKQWQSSTVKVSSELLAILLRDILRCGTNSLNMQIPPALLGSSVSVRKALLSGLLRGDGDVYYVNKPHAYVKNGKQRQSACNTICVGYFSSSPVLLRQVSFLAQGLGLLPVLKRGKPHLQFYGYAQMKKMSDLLVGHKGEKIQSYLTNSRRQSRSKIFQTNSSYATVPVRHLEVEPAETEVYSLEVQGTHTFATSGGVFVHNCIPVDPFYLSWKAKEYEFHTKFIELSGEVNTSIPHYVLSKVTDALNAQGKSLKGSTLLMLGLAYKADVNDVRESPSLKVAELLFKKEVNLIVNDPHVESARWNGHPLVSQELTAELIRQADCVLLMTNHSAYDYAWIAGEANLIVDTRNAFAGQTGRIVKL